MRLPLLALFAPYSKAVIVVGVEFRASSAQETMAPPVNL